MNEVKGKFGVTLILGVDIQAGDSYTSEDFLSIVDYNTPLLFDVGAKNGAQAFGGLTATVFYRSEQPKFIPIYSDSDTLCGTVYINSKSNGTINISNDTDRIIRANVYAFH